MMAEGRLEDWAEGRFDRWATDDGLLSTELALLVPIVLFGFVSLMMVGGRVVQAETEVQAAAEEAARVATLHNRFAVAAAEARRTADANLVTSGMTCAAGGPTVVTATSAGPVDLVPGTTVTVTVTCVADLRDVTHLGLPAVKTYTATAHEVVDIYRSSP